MSGYLFLVAAQSSVNAYDHHRNEKGKHRGDDAKSIATGSSSSSRSSISSSRGSFHRTRRASYIKPTSRPKKKFDMTTSTYVTVEESAYERRLQRYESKYSKLLDRSRYHLRNEMLSRYKLRDGETLFTEESLNTLRYTYFKEVTNDYDKICSRINQKKDGQYTLKYVRRLHESHQKLKDSNQGLPSMSVENLTVHDNHSTETINESEVSEESDDEDTDKVGSGQSIKKLMKSNQFWNNVYQDLKFSMMEVSFDYFELLPSLNHLAIFYKETIEYFLMNLDCLSCNLKGLEPEEYEDLKQCRFYYFKDLSYEWFKIMSNEHFKLFNDQSAFNSNVNMYHDNNFSIHRQLVNKLISCIMENLKNSIPDASKNQGVLKLWEGFINFLVFEMIVNDYSSIFLNHNKITDGLPAPNLDDDDVDDSHSDESFNSYSNQSLDPSINTHGTSNPSFDESNETHDLSRNIKNLNINTSARPSLSPISSIGENKVYDTMSYMNKRSGFVLELPTPPEDLLFPSLVKKVDDSAIDTKVHNKKKLLFSRLKNSRR